MSKEIRTFSTMTQELLTLADWLMTARCTHVAMERTGVYWKPVYNVLEGQFEVLVVNAQHVKVVPGRTTDVRDAEWLADVLRHGLFHASFIPSAAQPPCANARASGAPWSRSALALRTECRKSLRMPTSNVLGVSARAMIEALLIGEIDPYVLVELAGGAYATSARR